MADDQLPSAWKEWAKVANNFLNKVGKAAGIWYEPIHNKRIAKAKVEADSILIKGEFENERQRRAFQRLLHEEERNQANIESITEQSTEHLKDTAKPENMDDDWLTDFFDKAKKVSDAQMQSLWAKILAGEANQPGTFTKTTLQLVAVLEKSDAEMFASVCRFAMYLGSLETVIFDVNDDIYKEHNAGFATVNHLEDLGLLSLNHLTGYGRQQVPRKFWISYGSTRLGVEMPEGQTDFPIGTALLTSSGRQLIRLTNAQAVPGFIEYACEKWKKGQNIQVTPVATK